MNGYFNITYDFFYNPQWDLVAKNAVVKVGFVISFIDGIFKKSYSNLNRGQFEYYDIAAIAFRTGLPLKKAKLITEELINIDFITRIGNNCQLVNYEKYQKENEKKLICIQSVLSTVFYHLLKKKYNKSKYLNDLGYTTEQLLPHIESKFKEGMNWDNYGNWHLDHKIPKSWFNIYSKDGTINKDELSKRWALDNLQPLWAKDNILKGSRFIG